MNFDPEKLRAIKYYKVIPMHHEGYSYNDRAKETGFNNALSQN